MIKNFYAKDFRNIKEITIEPSQFINLISGNNGEGKSSILYGIEYLLTDNLNEKISEYVRWGCEKFILDATFVINNQNYIINIEGSKSAKKDLTITDLSDNVIGNYKNSEATKKLAEVIDPNIIRYSSISEQGKTAQILFDTPANRLKKLKEILGIDKIADLCDELKQDIDKKQEEIKLSEKELKLVEEKNYNFMDIPEVGDIDKIKSIFDILEKDKFIYELEFKQWEDYNKKLEDYNKAIRTLSVNNLNIENYKKEIIEKESSQITYNHTETEEELRELSSKYEKEKIEQEHKVDNYKKIQKRIIDLNSLIEKQKQELEKLQLRRISPSKWTEKDLKDTEEVTIQLKIELPQLEKELKLVEQGKCPTCGKDYIIENVDELIKKIEEYKSAIKTNDTFILQVKKDNEEYKKALNEQELVKVKRQSVQEKIDSYYNEFNNLDELDFDENSINNLCDYNTLLKEIKSKLDNRQQVLLHNVSISNQIKELESKIKVCEALIEQYKDIVQPKECTEPKSFNFTEYEECKKEIIIHEQKVQEKERIEKYNETIQQDKDSDKEKIKNIISLIDSISYEVSILKESRQILDKDFSAWLIDKGAEYIKEKMNDFFSSAYGKYSITFTQDKNSIDFYYSDGENISPCSMASGFEKSCLAIAFRIALSSLNNLGLMILDEIDSDASGERSLQLFESILENMGNTQFFIITHNEDTKEFLLQQNGSREFNVVEGTIN